MNTLIQRVGVRLAFIFVMATGAGTVHAADDVNQMFQMGRAAFYKGDHETAYALLTQVEASNPKHFETKALLAQIRAQKKSGTPTIKKTYDSLILPQVDFTEVTLAEAIEGLRGLSKNASDGKVIPNIIIKDPALGAKMLSLNIRNVPLSDAIQYLADLSGATSVYDKHAVIFTGAATAGN